MFTTDIQKLKNYYTDHRMWQGIPGIEVTKNGRIFATFYSGQKGETIGNYIMLVKSDDDGKTFSEPIAAAYLENHRCFDPCLWIDPKDRLWLFWAIQPETAVYGVCCDNPDDNELKWSEVKKIGHDVMMNKPVVLSTGEWILPISVWQRVNMAILDFMDSKHTEGAFAYKSSDNGESFVKLGAALTPPKDAAFHEHMIVELLDGRLMMLLRTLYGIGLSYSYDRGKTWSEVVDSGIKGPVSRFHITRLKSGKLLLINHYDFKERNNMTALLSDDDGKTWKWKLLLDERQDVSYPDAKEQNGYIYITYDRERGDDLKSIEEVYEKGREILIAKITEEDIMAGEIVSKGSYLKGIISKLGKFYDEKFSPYVDFVSHTPYDAAEILVNISSKDKIIKKLFELYPVNCLNMHKLDTEKLDLLIASFNESNSLENDKKIIKEIIELIVNVTEEKKEVLPVIERIKAIIEGNVTEEMSIKSIAKQVGMSYNYMSYLFKKVTGITVGEYRNELKITRAKKLLLTTDKSIGDIAIDCGFSSSSYFSERFLDSEGMTPTAYRKLHKI